MENANITSSVLNNQNNQAGQKNQIRLKYKSDLDKAVLIQNFEKRGWQKCQGDEDWNIYWALPWTVKNIFDPQTGHRLNEMQ